MTGSTSKLAHNPCAIKAIAGLSALGAVPAFGAAEPAGNARYKDASLSVEERVKDLMSRMTLGEKIGQIIALWATKKDVLVNAGADFSPEKASRLYPDSFGQVTRPSDRKGAPDIPGMETSSIRQRV